MTSTSIHRLGVHAIDKLRSSMLIGGLPQVVDELLQNALDAKATEIQVAVDAKVGIIEVQDNGCGMTKDEIFDFAGTIRYATSKCSSLEDLNNPLHLGFRGEALASIAEVARLEIISRHELSSSVVWKIISGGEVLGKGVSSSHPKRSNIGTTIIVRDLFYKYPVRQKMKKHETLEIEHVKNLTQRLAVIHHSVSFTLIDLFKQQKLLSTKPVSSLIASFLQVFGSCYSQFLQPVLSENTKLNITLTGAISIKGFHSQALQLLYLNSRILRRTDSAIHNLINDLFANSSFNKQNEEFREPDVIPKKRKGYLPKYTMDKHPVFILNIICPREYYDISLDPTKSIALFQQQESEIFQLIEDAVKDFLIKNNFLNEPSSQLAIKFTSSQIKSYSSSPYSQPVTAIAANSEILRPSSSQQKTPSEVVDNVSQLAEEDKSKNLIETGLDNNNINIDDNNSEDDNDENSFGGGSGNLSQSHISLLEGFSSPRSMESRYTAIVDPVTKKTHYVDTTTGLSYFQQPFIPSQDVPNSPGSPSPSLKSPLIQRALSANSRNYSPLRSPSPIYTNSRIIVGRNIINRAPEINQQAVMATSRALTFSSSSREDRCDDGDSREEENDDDGRADDDPMDKECEKDAEKGEKKSVRELFAEWQNPVFEIGESMIPQIKVASQSTDTHPISMASQLNSLSKFIESDLLEQTITKEMLQHVKVIGQADNKFICCKLSFDRNSAPEQIILVDQHAAHERVQLERMTKQYLRLPKLDGRAFRASGNIFDDLDLPNIDTVTVCEPNGLALQLSVQEVELCQVYQNHFRRWGIILSSQTLADSGEKVVIVKRMPTIVFDKFDVAPNIIQQTIKAHLVLLEETNGTTVACPSGILKLLNAKACRSAIKFGQPLSLEECKQLMKELSECDFPFQCAHGRPSLTPILSLSRFKKQNSVYRDSYTKRIRLENIPCHHGS